MGMAFTLRCAIVLLATSLLWPAAASARDVTRSDFGRRAPVEGERFSTESRTFQRNAAIAEKRFSVQEWHANYNTLGRKRANIDMAPREREVMKHRRLSFDRKATSMSRFEGRQAFIRNLDEVEHSRDALRHENVAVRRFDGPMGEVRAELGGEEELSVDDINRFFYMRNRRGGQEADEIPVNRAGMGGD